MEKDYPSIHQEAENAYIVKMLKRIYPETFVNKGTGWCELTWSLLDTYLRHLEKLFQRKTKKEYLETRNNGLMLYAQSILPPKLM